MKITLIMYATTFLFLSSVPLYAIKSNTVIATINTGINPNGIAITPDNRFAYIPNNNNYGVNVDQATVSVLNLTNNSVETIIHDVSFVQPYKIAINPAGTKAYVCNSTVTTVTIIDIATNTVEGTIDGFNGP